MKDETWKRKEDEKKEREREREGETRAPVCVGGMWSSVSERHPLEREREPRSLRSGCTSGRPLGPPYFLSPFTKRRDHPSTRTTTTTDELDDDPAPFRFSHHSPGHPLRHLPTSTRLPIPHPPTLAVPRTLQPTTYTTTRAAYPTAHFLASPSWPLFHFSISLIPSLTLRLDSLFLAGSPLRYRSAYASLSLSFSPSVSRFIARSLTGRPPSRPLLTPTSPCPSRLPLLL